jgi:hypothetical protein
VVIELRTIQIKIAPVSDGNYQESQPRGYCDDKLVDRAEKRKSKMRGDRAKRLVVDRSIKHQISPVFP